MENWINFLSGGVPGGILVLLLLLLIINLSLSFLKTSKLISAEKVKKNQFIYSGGLLILYLGLWLATRPPLPQVRIIILPTIQQGSNLKINVASFKLAEKFKRSADGNLQNKYFLHEWTWMYETLGPDSATNFESWERLAKRLKAGIILKATLKTDRIECVVLGPRDSVLISAVDERDLLQKCNKKFHLFRLKNVPEVPLNEGYLAGRWAILNRDYDAFERVSPDNAPLELRALKAEALVRKGLATSVDRERAKFLQTKNPDFELAKKILFDMIHRQQDTYETAYWLGRMAVYDQDYSKAELFFKKALVDQPSNPRIYYALSYLHADRLEELGFSSHIEILQKAVELDPGYREAVYSLAHAFYSSGTGTTSGSGTTRAQQVINTYLKINKDDLKILSLMASIELKLGHHDQALEMYLKISQQLPNDSNSFYNLGMVYFYKEKYQTALNNFLKAIQMDENLDAFLYAGITYRMMGDNQKALKYYRERIRRKTGDDDRWAKEAMKGIRKILADTTVKNVH